RATVDQWRTERLAGGAIPQLDLAAGDGQLAADCVDGRLTAGSGEGPSVGAERDRVDGFGVVERRGRGAGRFHRPQTRRPPPRAPAGRLRWPSAAACRRG